MKIKSESISLRFDNKAPCPAGRSKISSFSFRQTSPSNLKAMALDALSCSENSILYT